MSVVSRARQFSGLFSVLALSAGCATSAGAGAGNPSGSLADVAVAFVGGEVITLGQVDDKAAAGLMRARKQEYEARKEALGSVVDEHLLAREAKSRNLSAEALLKLEVTDKVLEPGQAEVDAVYEENKARIGDRTREEIDPQIREFLRSKAAQDAHTAFMAGLREKYPVEITLEPPRVSVSADDDPSKGAADAPVTIVEFSDFQCPFCSRVNPTIDELLKRYEGKVRVVFRDFPLDFHDQARGAAAAAQCAHDQGRFWEMHDALFEDQRNLEAEALDARAARIGLDVEAFKACRESGKYSAEVESDLNQGKSYGVTGTPAFFINGIMLEGAQPVEAFAEVIDGELKRKR